MRKRKSFFLIVMYVSIICLSLFSIGLESAEVHTLAVLPFNNNTGEKDMDWLSDGILDVMTNDLCQLRGLKVVERSRIKEVLKEIQLSFTGLVDEKTAQKAGKLIGADAVIIGGYQEYGNVIRLTARLVEVETGEIYTSVKVTGPMEKIFALQDEISFKFLNSLKYKVSEEERNKLTIIPTKSIDAFRLYSEGLSFYDRGKFNEAKDKFSNALSLDPDYTDAQREYARVLRELGLTEAEYLKYKGRSNELLGIFIGSVIGGGCFGAWVGGGSTNGKIIGSTIGLAVALYSLFIAKRNTVISKYIVDAVFNYNPTLSVESVYYFNSDGKRCYDDAKAKSAKIIASTKSGKKIYLRLKKYGKNKWKVIGTGW